MIARSKKLVEIDNETSDTIFGRLANRASIENDLVGFFPA
jgi:hypothetical protein